MEKAYFAGGCFWCTEEIFGRLKGVLEVVPGYAGGTSKNPSYETVSSGTTNHAETVEIHFNPKKIDYTKLVKIFFTIHDPTTKNRQGADVGTQYRSAIFTISKDQELAANILLKTIQKDYSATIVTTVEPLNTFYKAEEYHKNYYDKNQSAPYCQLVISPKLKKFEEKYRNLLK